MERSLFTPEQIMFRDSFRAFLKEHVAPHHEQWEKDEIVPRDLWVEAGKLGFLGTAVEEKYGGGGDPDFRFNAIVSEETTRGGYSGVGFMLHNDVVQPYLTELATEEQKQRWLPGFVSGEIITAIAMTEPGTGSDLQGIKTTAKKDGNDWILNGSKTFITNGINADLVIVVARTNPDAGAQGFSLLVVERGMEGFERGRNLDKVGLKAQDTAELHFNNVRIPAENLLGEEGMGFIYLMKNLPQERLSIAVVAAAAMESCLAMTIEYCRDRKAFGRNIGAFQNTRFVLAELATETQMVRLAVDKYIEMLNEKTLTVQDAAMIKWWSTELQTKLIDRCVQLHGGYGYMREYPIAKAFLDSRVQTIYGGTTEIMKEIIGRSLNL
ncbi:acyl-CoA dehydrogenase family protein [Hoyosella subflava]|uniref:Acyl-CoA dehydrogenase n=1 Tax=Hoyosella subflava (strain DSM 45089 / JCM 17490 / NBRC 109087 / DQS3-9A1) TaxID=443218 RepID=F6EM42_HOYSD|nr:acyl-CoA dehydrogenase family protein [Hoyosella subflava]AEF39248.1 Acyl-CoA dehydrogenase [Hoyosella subflava DQS3-9A1]